MPLPGKQHKVSAKLKEPSQLCSYVQCATMHLSIFIFFCSLADICVEQTSISPSNERPGIPSAQHQMTSDSALLWTGSREDSCRFVSVDRKVPASAVCDNHILFNRLLTLLDCRGHDLRHPFYRTLGQWGNNWPAGMSLISSGTLNTWTQHSTPLVRCLIQTPHWVMPWRLCRPWYRFNCDGGGRRKWETCISLAYITHDVCVWLWHWSITES